MQIGIIGAGAMGRTLAEGLAGRDHHVRIANTRSPEELAAWASDVGVTPVSIFGAVDAADVVILAIPTKAVVMLPRELFAHAPNTLVVVDIGNYHPELRDGRIAAIDTGKLDSQWVADVIGRPVVKAFNNILAESLADKGVSKGTSGRIALSVAGDQPEAKQTVMHLVDELGFDPVDCGGLDQSWRQQPGTPAYCHDLDAPGLRRALAEADQSRIAAYRAEREAEIKRQIASNARRD